MKKKRWLLKSQPDAGLLDTLRGQIKTTEILLKLIAQRNITSLQDALSYFQPSLSSIHPPFLMKNMERAIARIQKAMERGETIVVYGDYDVDGTTAVSIVYSYFAKLYDKLLYYIPDRFKEGYGISNLSIDWAKENNVTLVIALDCGIKSLSEVQDGQTKGIDFIICDHHTPGDTLPNAYAVLNPKQEGCEYPYKELSGCGIGYKLIQAYSEYYKIDWNPEEYLDLVAISIASDIVHMTDENRILTYFGLNRINTNPRPGIKALIVLSGAKGELDVNDLVFKLGPRINAAGRISSGKIAVEMLVEPSYNRALEIANQINANNIDRQSVDKVITQQALDMIEELKLHERKTTVLFDKEWHKGVIGIVASRLIEKYYRPTVLLTESNGYAVGSARSVPGFDLYNAIKECDEILEQWGGHKAAAGLTMPLENVDQFIEKFEQAVAKSISEEMLTPVIDYDLELELKDITFTFCRSMNRFGPFGPENMRPVFITRGVKNAFKPKVVGNNHLQLTIKNPPGEIEVGEKYTHFRYGIVEVVSSESGTVTFEAHNEKGNPVSHKATPEDFVSSVSGYFKAIGFGLGDFLKDVEKADSYDICYTLDISEYNGENYISINIKDIQIPVNAA